MTARLPDSPGTTFVLGIDLAWGMRAPTGIAVLDVGTPVGKEGGNGVSWDGAGKLVEYASLRTDAEIDTRLATYLKGPCLVAVDAPLIVLNATGRRKCEAALSRAFAAQHAGTYPSNTGLPSFADGGRAAAFARRHRLDIDATIPLGIGQRRAIEVYPHSATVAIFDLPKVLAYKARPSRSLDSRRAALLHLVGLLQELTRPSELPLLTIPPGMLEAISGQIDAAPTAAALRRLEDPLDALVCAYVGLVFLAGRACVVGDGATGAIVTPARERHLRLLGDYAHGATPIR